MNHKFYREFSDLTLIVVFDCLSTYYKQFYHIFCNDVFDSML